MFIAGVVLSRKALNILSVAGVKDSKKLRPSKRQKLFPKITSLAKAIIILRYNPQTIDRVNLTSLTLQGFTKILINIANLGIHVKEVYIDAVTYRHALDIVSKYLPKGAKLTYEAKADEKFVAVGAASIIAKYLRDKHIESLKERYGDFGSGYPSDPKTVEWLRRKVGSDGIKELPPIVRQSWKTLRRFMNEEAVIKPEKTVINWDQKPFP